MNKLSLLFAAVILAIIASWYSFRGDIFQEASHERVLSKVMWEDAEHKTIDAGSKRIKTHLESCRQAISELTNKHEKVLGQFDTFSTVLLNVYIEGKGLIEKDVHQVIDAMQLAAVSHKDQKRKNKGKTPFIYHPICVAEHLMCIGRIHDKDIIIAALLHDTIEGTPLTIEKIEEDFGARIAGFVKEMTDDPTLSKEARKQSQVLHAAEASAGAAQIRLADKLANLRDLASDAPPNWEKGRVEAYFLWAKSVVDNLPWVNERLKTAVDEELENFWNS